MMGTFSLRNATSVSHMPAIELQTHGPVARILIDNPARKNAFSRAMWRAVAQAVTQARAMVGLRVLVLQSAAPGCFAAGADISEFESIHQKPESSLEANAEIQAAVNALADFPLPTLALIDGPCVGGGVAIALACDIRLASSRSRFAVTPARLGLSYHPDDIRRVVRACGRAAAAELLFSGQVWSASRGLRVGLVNEVYDEPEFMPACESLIQAISSSSLDALHALKRGLDAVERADASALVASEREFEALFAMPDFIEGRNAFLQKRSAQFPSHAPLTE